MLGVHGVGETCWHWKTRSIYRDNRFDNLAWHKGVDYRYKLASDNPRKDVQAVFVSGVLKPPATNRGVSPRNDNDISPCCRCGFPTEQAKLSIAFPHGATVCPTCYKIVMR